MGLGGEAFVGGVDFGHAFGGFFEDGFGEALGLEAVGVEFFDFLAVGAFDVVGGGVGAEAEKLEVGGAGVVGGGGGVAACVGVSAGHLCEELVDECGGKVEDLCGGEEELALDGAEVVVGAGDFEHELEGDEACFEVGHGVCELCGVGFDAGGGVFCLDEDVLGVAAHGVGEVEAVHDALDNGDFVFVDAAVALGDFCQEWHEDGEVVFEGLFAAESEAAHLCTYDGAEEGCEEA